jgi:hypothetical protein
MPAENSHGGEKTRHERGVSKHPQAEKGRALTFAAGSCCMPSQKPPLGDFRVWYQVNHAIQSFAAHNGVCLQLVGTSGSG